MRLLRLLQSARSAPEANFPQKASKVPKLLHYFPELQPRKSREKERQAILGDCMLEQGEDGASAGRADVVEAISNMVSTYWGSAIREDVLKGDEGASAATSSSKVAKIYELSLSASCVPCGVRAWLVILLDPRPGDTRTKYSGARPLRLKPLRAR